MSKSRHLTSFAILLALSICSPSKPMAEEPSDPAVKEYLDKYYPFIEQGGEPPGRYAPDPQLHGALTWQGQNGWRTRHGEAVVVWSSGRPSSVYGARYPDGSRGKVEHVLDHGFRRHAMGPKRWLYGTIDVRPADVLFADGAQPVYTPPPLSDRRYRLPISPTSKPSWRATNHFSRPSTRTGSRASSTSCSGTGTS